MEIAVASTTSTVMHLNVGGQLFVTSKSTLLQYKDSKLAALIRGKQLPKDNQGHDFVDRDGELFKQVLNFLRTGKLITPRDYSNYEALAKEAEFFGLGALNEAIHQRKQQLNASFDIVQVRCAKGPSYSSCSVTGMLQVLREIFPDDGRQLNANLDVRSSVSYGGFGGKAACLELRGEFPWTCLYKIISMHGFRFKSVGSSSDSPNQACEIWVFERAN